MTIKYNEIHNKNFNKKDAYVLRSITFPTNKHQD